MNKKILKNKMYGFSLMEVLVALLVLSIGLLGLAALQGVSIKTNHGAYQRSQATFLAYDMIDRIRANRSVALDEDYDLVMAADPAVPGGTATLAEEDLYDWITNFVSALLPSGDGSIDCDNNGYCTIVIQWDESRQGGTAEDSAVTTATFTYTAQI